MTNSRDRYQEAAESAQAALTRAAGSDGAPRPSAPGPAKADGSPLSTLTKAFGRFRDPNK